MTALSANTNATADFSVLPNILDKYSQYSYYFRLYLADPTDRTQQVTLAETASSVVSIQEVRITSVTGMNRDSGIGLSTKFEMVLKQPFGATFVDSIIDAANFLGIQQPFTVPYWLELTFRARDPNSQAVITDETIGQLKWAWPLIFINTEISAQAQGSTYNISARYLHDTAFENTNETLTTSISIPAATVGEFFEGFAQALSQHESQRLGILFPNSYEFLIEDPEISNARLIPDSTDEITDRHIQLEPAGNKTLVVFQPNTSIRYIIETVLMSTQYFQDRATRLVDPNGDNDDIKTTDLFRQLFRVVPRVEFKQFDPRTNNYSKKFTYGILPYEFTTALVSAQDYIARQNIDNSQQVSEYVKTGKLRKVYNYLFTGLNDQVLDFDFKFAFNWYLAAVWQMGQTINAANADFAPKINELEDQEQRVQTLRQQLERINAQPAPARQSDDASIVDAIGINTARDGTREQLREAENRLQVRRTEVDRLITQQTNESRLRARTKAEEAGFDLNQQVFAEKLTEASLSGELLLSPPVIYTKSGEFSRSLEGTSGPARLKISMMMEQLTSPTAKDLQNVQIKIKGDPYWLEPDPINGANDPDNLLSFLGRPARTVNTINNDSTNTQTYFLFRAFLPQPAGKPETRARAGNRPTPAAATPAARSPPRNANTVINGLYWTKVIEHEFVGGQFTQTITGTRDVTVNINNIEYDQNGVPIVRRQVDRVEQREPAPPTRVRRSAQESPTNREAQTPDPVPVATDTLVAARVPLVLTPLTRGEKLRIALTRPLRQIFRPINESRDVLDRNR